MARQWTVMVYMGADNIPQVERNLAEEAASDLDEMKSVGSDADEQTLKYAVVFLGEDSIIFNTDYPHPDAPDPRTVLPDLMRQPISESAKRKIAWDNSIRLYGPRLLNANP